MSWISKQRFEMPTMGGFRESVTSDSLAAALRPHCEERGDSRS